MLAQDLLGHKMISYSEVTGSGKEQKNFSLVEIGAASRYACEDADATEALAKFLHEMGVTPPVLQAKLSLLPSTLPTEVTTVLLEQRGKV